MRFLITAGPTREPLDPVRFFSNRSSGKMGYALAEAAVRDGHEVVLISGPVALAGPKGVEVIQIESAAEMALAVRERLLVADVAIFSAAVADYAPTVVAGEKLKKHAEEMVLRLVRTVDILGSVRGWGFGGVLVGFAAETEHVLMNAQAKLARKGCDLLVANDVSRRDIGFDAEENEVTLLWADGRMEAVRKLPKRELAEKLIGLCVKLVK